MKYSGSFNQSLKIQSRIIGALFLREILTRYGRHNIGFFWLFVEPMIFNLGVLIIRFVMHEKTFGLNLVPFVATGYATIILWRNTINRAGNAIEPNRSLLHHRNVRVFDIFVARTILELIGSSLSFLIIMSTLIATDLMAPPNDVIKIVEGWLLLAWFAGSFSFIVGGLAFFNEVFDRVWHIITYLFLPICGAFSITAFAPPALQTVLNWVPIVSCVELIREGYFGVFVDSTYNIPYVVVFNLINTLIGFYLVSRVSLHVEGA